MINNMDMGMNIGQMEHHLKVNMHKVKSMVQVSLCGLIEVLLMENSMKIIFAGKEYMNGQMAEYIMEIGKTIKWKGMAHLHGRTVENMQDNILMT